VTSTAATAASSLTLAANVTDALQLGAGYVVAMEHRCSKEDHRDDTRNRGPATNDDKKNMNDLK
jgi:hypothetical protein